MTVILCSGLRLAIVMFFDGAELALILAEVT